MNTFVVIGQTKWQVADDGLVGRPGLLLLHGFTGCIALWDDVVDLLKTDFRCIRIDLPGHGKTETSANEASFHMEPVARALTELLDRLKIDRIHVWGYSMGGRLALHLALMFPARVQCLILESASPGLADATERRQRKDADDRLANQIKQNGVAAFVDEWMSRPLFAAQRTLPAKRQQRARELRLQQTAAGLALSLHGMGVGVQQPLHDQLGELQSPTLVMAGELDDKFRAIGMSMADAIPRAVYCLMPQAGHAPYWEQPEACVNMVRPFLQGDGISGDHTVAGG